MLMTTTIMPSVKMSNIPARLRMTVKTKVLKPKMMASVAAMDRRSFQMLIGIGYGRVALIFFFPNSEDNGCYWLWLAARGEL